MRNEGIDYRTAFKIVNNQIDKVPLSVMERFCEKAWCTPNDIITWKPDDENTSIDEKHPLHKLKRKYAAYNPTLQLNKLTPDQIQQVQAFVASLGEENK